MKWCKYIARDARWRTGVGLWLFAASLLPTLGSTVDDVVATEMHNHGIVVALSRRWPLPEQRYRAWHRGEENLPFALGQVQFVQVAPDTWVANLIGQRDIRSRDGVPPIRYEALREGLRRVALEAKQLNASVHMPRIGCGLAGGNWAEVGVIVDQELVAPGVPVTVYDLPAQRGT